MIKKFEIIQSYSQEDKIKNYSNLFLENDKNTTEHKLQSKYKYLDRSFETCALEITEILKDVGFKKEEIVIFSFCNNQHNYINSLQYRFDVFSSTFGNFVNLRIEFLFSI